MPESDREAALLNVCAKTWAESFSEVMRIFSCALCIHLHHMDQSVERKPRDTAGYTTGNTLVYIPCTSASGSHYIVLLYFYQSQQDGTVGDIGQYARIQDSQAKLLSPMETKVYSSQNPGQGCNCSHKLVQNLHCIHPNKAN